MAAELDLCYVEATGLIREAVKHVLSRDSCGEKLREDLVQWQKTESGETAPQALALAEPGYCREDTAIPFELVVKVHQHLKTDPLSSGPLYLHELVSGSSLSLPEVKFPPRNPELVSRLERVQAMADNKAYKRMVKNVDVSRDNSEFYQLGLEVQATNRQIWTMLNFLLTVLGAFFFGYFVCYYAGYSMPVCMAVGLVLGTMVFMADLYFLVRTDILPPNYSKQKNPPRGKQKKD